MIDLHTHSPGDLMNEEFAGRVIEGAGLPTDSLSTVLSNARLLLEKIRSPL